MVVVPCCFSGPLLRCVGENLSTGIRRKGSELAVEDFREALVSFGLGGDNATADRLFNLYDWRQSKTVNFQVFNHTSIFLVLIWYCSVGSSKTCAYHT